MIVEDRRPTDTRKGGRLKNTFIAKSTSNTFSIVFLFLEEKTSGFGLPNSELTASVFVPHQESPMWI